MWPAILPSPLRLLLASLLFPPDTSQNTLQFYLRHEHAVSATNHIVFADVPGNSLLDAAATPFVVNTAPLITHRPSSLLAHSKAIHRSRQHAQSSLLDWWGEEVQGPDVKSRESLLTLAKMTFDAYLEPSDKEWYELDPQWNKVSPFPSHGLRCEHDGHRQTHPFGWEPDADGFRGHIFVSTDNSTVIISIKGTSAGWIFSGGPTAQKDKLNDNLLFSCCCARVGPTWSTVCDCFSGGYRCDQTCIENALIGDSLFYPIGMVKYSTSTVNSAHIPFRTCTTM